VVAINAFPTDTAEELAYVEDRCREMGADAVLSEVWAKGGEGGVKLAERVVEVAESGKANFSPLYTLEVSAQEKIETIAKEIYGADGVEFSSKALNDIKKFTEDGMGDLPICMAKTQYSLSDDPTLLGRPSGFTVNISEVKVSAGAGFLVAMTGDIMRMPGLPKVPSANKIDILEDGEIVGLF
jgi:formate--tetrahydrofolate ligase